MGKMGGTELIGCAKIENWFMLCNTGLPLCHSCLLPLTSMIQMILWVGGWMTHALTLVT